MSATRPLPLGVGGTPRDTLYHEFECSQCGKTARNSYCEPIRTEMLQWLLCFHCHYWRDFELKTNPVRTTIIEGHIYSPGNRTQGEWRGMAGRRFDIEYIEPSVYAGQRCTTFDLWSGGAMPEELRIKFPDTARFLGGAHKVQVGEMTCFNGSDLKSEPYPLPQEIERRVEKVATRLKGEAIK